MNYLYTTIALLLFSVSVTAQNFITVSNRVATPETISASFHQISSFIFEIESEENFKYRAFLKEAKYSKKTYHISQERYTKRELVKLFRKAAIKADDGKEFRLLLTAENFNIANELSQEDMQSIFHLFRKDSLEKYLDDLSYGL